jgi:hypothetical protein
MAPNNRARTPLPELFSRSVATLALRDPVLIETYDRFAFGELLQHDTLAARA